MKPWHRLLIGCFLFASLLYFVDWQQTVMHFLHMSPIWTVAALIIITSNVPWSGYKWKILLAAQGKKASMWSLARYYWISAFFSNFLPTSVGGDAVRFFLVKDLGPKSNIAASIIWERATGFIVLIGWSALALLMRPQYFDVGPLLLLLWAAVIAGVAGIVCFLVLPGKIKAILQGYIGGKNKFGWKFAKKLIHFCEAVEYYNTRKEAILRAILFSFPFYVNGVFFNFFLLKSIGSDFPLKEIFFLMPIIPLVSLLPISLNGLGISEGAFVIFYAQAGLPPSEALAVAVARRVLHLLASSGGGLIWIPVRHKQRV
jgi:uncharacterized protein (TIRG00374 family)